MLFKGIRDQMFPGDDKPRNTLVVKKWFAAHTAVVTKHYRGREKNVSGGSFMPATRNLRWYINIRGQRSKSSEWKMEDYMFISKSLVGCSNIVYDDSKKAPGDYKFTIVDPEMYAKSGYGLFFNRDFLLHECVGVYCGDLVLKCDLADTGYNIEWKHNDHYVVDAHGPGYPMYLGWHYANNPGGRAGANVFVDKDMLVFCTKDVKKGDEAFFFYGEERDLIDNLVAPPANQDGNGITATEITKKKKVGRKRKSAK